MRWSAVVLLGVGAVACERPPAPEEIAARTASKASELIRGANEAAQSANGASSLSSVTAAVNAMRGSFDSVPVSGEARCPPGATCATVEARPPTAPAQQEVESATEKMARFLGERVFTKENVESTEPGGAVFRLEGTDLCTNGEQVPTPECIEEVDRLEVRVRAVTGPGEAVDLYLWIGPDRRQPLVLKIREGSLSAAVDLAELKAVLELAQAGGSSAALPVMSGQLELLLERHGEGDYGLGLSVLKEISIVATDEVGATRSFITAAKTPVWAFRIEGPRRRITFDLDLGVTQYTFPYAPDVSAFGRAGQQMTLHLSGLSFAFSAEEGQRDFVVAHLGLGEAQSYLTLDKHTLFTADLNRLSGRHFDVSMEAGADGLPAIRVLPELDLSAGFFLRPLMVDPDAYVPSFYEDERYRLRLSGGSAPAVKPLRPAPEKGFPGGLEVLSGELRLETDRAGVPPVVVKQGQCLLDRSSIDPSAHPLLGHFEVRACP
ncbi:MAG: hypothetical protein HYZ28_06520 [Myxococcales bacterium]|nr:hypothetical protein [Myxococcales bacterium]